MSKKDILIIENLASYEKLINRDKAHYDINMMVMPGTLEDKQVRSFNVLSATSSPNMSAFHPKKIIFSAIISISCCYAYVKFTAHTPNR